MMNEMTAEEAIKWLKDIERSFPEAYFREWRKALDLAMKALEPKPMEKFDDVKTHIQRLAGDYKCWDNRLTWEEALELNRMLEAQPSEDCISRQKALDCFEQTNTRQGAKYAIETLPSVTPRRDLALTSQDCISREAVIDHINLYPKIIGNRSDLALEIKHLPSVTPKYTDEEIDKAQAVEQAYVDKMVELAVEETKRPRGKWTKCKSRFGTEYFKCSECGRKLNWIDSDDNYCNSCGSDNSESTKELYKEKLAEISGGGEE